MKKAIIVLVGAGTLVLTAFSNCTGGFQADLDSVSSSSNSGLKAMGDVSLLREADAQVYVPPDLTYGPQFSVKVTTTCSDYGSATLQGNIVRSTTSLVLTLKNKSSGLTCTYS